MSLSLIAMIVGGVWLIYSLLYKPEWVAILLFVAIIADINFDLKGIPLNFRAFVALVLLGKVVIDAKPIPGPSFFSTSYSRYIIIFVLYVLAITFENGLLTTSVAKEFIFDLIYAYLAYYFFMKEGGYKIFRLSIIFAGFSCLGDLVWTYMQGDQGLIIQRIYFQFTPAYGIFNHNFFGYICSVAFVFLLADYLSENGKKINLLMMPCMFLGVLLSTSRSSILILIIVSIVLIVRGLMSATSNKKASRLVMVVISCLALCFFLFQMLNSIFHVDSGFFDQITARLVDEPVAIFNRAMGNEFKADSLDSMDWRAKASEIAYNTFVNILGPDEQFMGIGFEGFLKRAYGDEGYDAHNGILLMLIEFGIVGSLIYFSMLFSFIAQFWKSRIFSPVMVCLIFIILYVTSHNRELIGGFMFLITGSLAAQLQYHDLPEKELAEEGLSEEELPEISGEY